MLWAVIMAGGKGTRFWPESRVALPKQFLSLFDDKSLIEQTVERLAPLIPLQRIIVVTQADKVSLVRKLLKLPKSQVIGEPVGRNTAPCLLLAASLIYKKDPQAVLALLPADHVIKKKKAFLKALRVGAGVANAQGCPVTFGLKPSFAGTGYGYLEIDKCIQKESGLDICRLKRFHEKPSKVKAKRFVRSKRFLWNSGMFLWRADAVLIASQKYLPNGYKLARKITEGNLQKALDQHFHKMPNISIDYAFMEKMKGKILAIPVDFGWSDVGGWKALADLLQKDKDGNTLLADTVSFQSHGNFVKSSKRLVALVGVKDLVVVDTPDALLICSMAESESIKEIVQQLNKNNKKQYL